MRPILVMNPRTDATFVEFVLDQVANETDHEPAALQGRLRERYPAAMVRVRALANEPATVWYVYRDGRWTLPDPTAPEEVPEHDGAS